MATEMPCNAVGKGDRRCWLDADHDGPHEDDSSLPWEPPVDYRATCPTCGAPAIAIVMRSERSTLAANPSTASFPSKGPRPDVLDEVEIEVCSKCGALLLNPTCDNCGAES